MKSFTRGKIIAILAVCVLAFAGVAWAAVSAGILTSSDEAVDLTAAASYRGGDAINPITFTGDEATLEGTITPATGAEIDALGTSAVGAYDSVLANDAGGAIQLRDAQVLNIKPGTGEEIAPGDQNHGIFRFNGGTVNMYAANDNRPDVPGGFMNMFDGGVFMMSGRLNLAHSNALGRSPLTLGHNTTLGVIETNNLDFGNDDPTGQPIPNQTIAVRRSDNNSTAANGNQSQATRPVTFNTPLVGPDNEPSVLRINNAITQGNNAAPANPDYNHVQLVKTGEGQMIIGAAGATNTGGTLVREGILEVDGGNTNRYSGMLGFAYQNAQPNEGVAAKLNYSDVVGGGDNSGQDPVYQDTDDANDPLYTQFVNPLTIEAAGTVRLNRSQFIGDLNGEGNLVFSRFVAGGQNVIPQLTMQLNDARTVEENGANAEFSGVISGPVNLVLDNPSAVTGSGGVNVGNVDAFDTFPRTQALTGVNVISGDTFIKDGTLSINSARAIGDGELRIGMYASAYSNAANGVDAGAQNFRGFGETQNVATLHASDSFTLDQPTLVYAIGKVGNGAVAVGDDSIRFFGNNPDNNTDPAWGGLGVTGGRYHRGNQFVNLVASRGETLGFSNITLSAERAAIATIAQYNDRNDVRYIMRNAMAVNDNLDENPSWDGTVAFTRSWDLTAATAARKFGFDIVGGTLRLEQTQEGGYALVGIRQGATLALGAAARDFNDDMEIVLESDARICVTPQVSDLAASYQEARDTKEPVFLADSINYTGLGAGTGHDSKYLVVQVDLSNIGNQVTDQWIRLVGSNSAPEWENIQIRQAGADQGSLQYKVKIAQPGSDEFDANYSVTPFCDQNRYSIYVNIKKLDQPVTPPAAVSEDQTMVTLGDGVPASFAASADVNIPFTVVSPDVYNTFDVETTPATDWRVETVDAAAGTYRIVGTMPATAVSYYVTAQNAAGETWKSDTYPMALTSTTGTTTSSGGGCDAGFGAFALIAAAGALVLRKKG